MPPLAMFVFQLVCVSLGIARSALDELTEFTQTKVPSMHNAVLADKPIAHVEVARAEAALDGARSFLYDTVDEIWQTVAAGGEPTRRQIALGRIACIQAVETGATVTRTATTLAGGTSIYQGSSLQRNARDAEAVTHQADPYARDPFHVNYDVFPSGEEFVMVQGETRSGKLMAIVNWTEELRSAHAERREPWRTLPCVARFRRLLRIRSCSQLARPPAWLNA